MKSKWMKIAAIMLVVGFMATTFAIAGEEAITGMVEQTDQGIVISADNGETYMVQGQDLSSMVGKNVKAMGTLAESESGKTLNVTSVEEIKE